MSPTVKPAPMNLGPSLKELGILRKRGWKQTLPQVKQQISQKKKNTTHTHKRKPNTRKFVQINLHRSKAAMAV
jgi:hypothetical protein